MKNIFETIIGFVVLLIAAGFTYFVYQNSGDTIDKDTQYTLEANFDNIDGIKVGSAIKISGIIIGKVTDAILDHDTYSAVVTMALSKKIKLPEDSSAQIISSSLLGDKYISIVPGTEEKILQEGDAIEFTQSSINLEGLISKFLFGLKDNNSDPNEGEDGNSSKSYEKLSGQNYIFNESGTKNSIS